MLRDHFPDFLRFFFPAVAEEVDLETAPEFLDTELKHFSRSNAAPHRLADLLVKVRRKTGEEELLYCHIEVQGRRVTPNTLIDIVLSLLSPTEWNVFTLTRNRFGN